MRRAWDRASLIRLVLVGGAAWICVHAGPRATEVALAAPEPPSTAPRTIVVAADGTGDYRSIQEAIDQVGRGGTVLIKAGAYAEDVTIHSKEHLRVVGEGRDRVTILGRDRVGVFHIGRWPYGTADIELSGVTINEHGGHALGMFNGRAIVLRDVRVKGMVFAQQVRDVRIERSLIGGSETTGVQFADSQAVLIGNVIHDNDHGVAVTGNSEVRLEHNVITRNLFEGVVVADGARALLVGNTIVKNGGGAAFLGTSHSEVSGNIVGLNKVGFVVAAESKPAISYNALYNNSEGDYVAAGPPRRPAPELKAASDVRADPRFVDPAADDFRLRRDTPLIRLGGFAYLGALAPVDGSP